MTELAALIDKFLPKEASRILKTDASLSAKDTDVASICSPEEEWLAISYPFTSEYKGCFIFIFSKPSIASVRFLEITVADPEGATTEEACEEISNQMLGRMLGDISEIGLDFDIAYPGKVIKRSDMMGMTDSVDLLSSCELGKYGHIHVCMNMEKDIKNAMTETAEEMETEILSERPKRVLIVDDSPVMCAFLEKIFMENGYEIAGKASDGLEAIEQFEKTCPDLMTLDIVMPKLKGTEVLERIIAKHPEAAIIMASSVSDAKTVMKCLKMGAKRYIIKPYDKEAVMAAVEKALML